MTAIKITPRDITIVGLILFIIILLFWRPCNKDATLNEWKQRAHRADSLEKVTTRLQATIEETRTEYTKDTAAARKETEAALNDKKIAEKKLIASQQTIYRLADKLDKSRTDTLGEFVKVNPSFVEDCDSIKIVALNQQTQIDDYTEESRESDKLLKYETKIRDDRIEKEEKYSDSLLSVNKAQSVELKAAIKAGKPRGRLLGGVGLIGNELNPLSGTKINIAYQSKGGKQYQVGGLLLRGQVYYEAGVLITLIK